MKKTEKIVAAILTMVIGVLLIVMKDNFIGILMTVAGVCLIVLGVVDIFARAIPPAVVKLVSALLIIICGWALVEAVLYIVAAALLIIGILLLYDKLKNKPTCSTLIAKILEYVLPSVMIAIGILLLFCQSVAVNFIFILSGILTLIAGGVLLFSAFYSE